jgi:hypothetical protein
VESQDLALDAELVLDEVLTATRTSWLSAFMRVAGRRSGYVGLVAWWAWRDALADGCEVADAIEEARDAARAATRFESAWRRRPFATLDAAVLYADAAVRSAL